MITTRESINYQFSLIFGYSNSNDLIVGDVVGPGKLTRKKVQELAIDVVKFLRMYNAVLRDYSGSELFSIEFALYNYDEKDSQLKIYPKSMILIPGKFKDCESLILALKPETGYLDIHKSKESIDDISRLFFEVEEYTDHPDLSLEQKEQVSQKFATRFSIKLYGDLIEDKWNKKLIGVSTSLPTEKEMLSSYAQINSDVEILWHKRPREFVIDNPSFQKIQTPFKEQSAIEHMKYSISEPSANFIVENTLKLGTNLINLSNTGTIDESQDHIISYLINTIEKDLEGIKEPHTVNWLLSYCEKQLNELVSYTNKFVNYTKEFLITGEMGDLEILLEKFKNFIQEKGKMENEDYTDITALAQDSIRQSVIQKSDLRVVEFSSIITYFGMILNNSFKLLRTTFPKYLARRRLKTLINELVDKLENDFENEQKPAKVLGNKLIQKFRLFLLNQIEINPIMQAEIIRFNERELIKEFNNLVNQNLELFFEDLELNISDLVSFAEVMMEKNLDIIKPHIEKFNSFSNELHFLLSYILRYTTINRYLKDEPDAEISDPVNFANRFHRFLEKRIGGINLAWKIYILEWIKDYAKQFFKMETPKGWTLKEVYEDFINYFEEREHKEQQADNFLDFLDIYIVSVPNEQERIGLLEFFKQYELSIEIKTEFPKYIKQKIEGIINSLDIPEEENLPINFTSLGEDDSFYNYIKESELKYFSKLIPRPLSLILRHNLSNEENELFKADLFHVLNFRFWGEKKLQINISNNFKEVYREWIRQL